MASIALASLRQSIENIFNQQPNSLSPIQNKQIRSIYNQVLFLQQFAQDSPATPNFPDRKVADLAHEAKTVIENFILEQLQKIRQEIDSIVWENVDEFQFNTSLPVNPSSPSITADSQVSDLSSKTSPFMVSLGDDLLAIKSRLCGGSSKLQFIPIVGMGGIGKTTLARNVFNDPYTTQYFDIRAWVTVSQDYSTQKTFSDLMDSMKGFVEEKSGQSNEVTIYKGLKGRRYLIVLDDVWCTKTCDDLRHVFPNDHNGSRIILTTRLSDVAVYFDSQSPLHQMRFMSDEESWELIRHRVLGDEHCSPLLKEIGKKIAKNCRGLPLAVVVIAGLLSTVRREPIPWRTIAENVSSIFATKDDGKFDGILSLSYTHLPHHLRSCFLYMGAFPKNLDIRASKLVRLWVADDFLRHSEGSSKSLEDEAEECLEDLANRNLVLVTRRKYNGKIKSCSLHDLIRDMCIKKAQETNFFVNLIERYFNLEDKQQQQHHFIADIEGQNRLSVRYPMLRYLSGAYHPSIQTLMCFPSYRHEDPPEEIGKEFLKSVRSLRVLDAQNVEIESLSHEIFELIHLRYLAIHFRSYFTIPVAILKLQSLQTLVIDVRSCDTMIDFTNVECLPEEIWMLPQLRHLICYGKFPYPKDAITSTLENLQTLSLVFHDVCVEGILEKMPNIKKLGLDCSSYDYGAHLNNLVHLHHLENLELRNGDWRRESICFPRTLRKLSLCNMWIPWSEMSAIGSSLPNLQVLKLRSFTCVDSTWETSQGDFPELQFLLIEIRGLEHWISESDHFPRLKFLLLHNCIYLDEIPEGFGEIATLEVIEIKSYSLAESLVESAKRVQEEQLSYGNDTVQLRLIYGKSI